jgi:hypothetical protein
VQKINLKKKKEKKKEKRKRRRRRRYGKGNSMVTKGLMKISLPYQRT